jgi:hypothetical protein
MAMFHTQIARLSACTIYKLFVYLYNKVFIKLIEGSVVSIDVKLLLNVNYRRF